MYECAYVCMCVHVDSILRRAESSKHSIFWLLSLLVAALML